MKEFYLLLLTGILNVDLGFTQNTPIRFAGVGSNATAGRVEVFHNNQWGTICDDKFRSGYEATVICRMINGTGSNPTGKAVNSTVFGPGTGPIWLDDVQCDSRDTDISRCQSRGWNISDCSHAEDVGVICVLEGLATTASPVSTSKAPPVIQPSNCSTNNPVLRLKGPEKMNGIGFVEVLLNNQWGSVCDDLWGIDDAKVVCGMLCYDRNQARAGAPTEVDYVRNNVSLTTNMDDVECTGTETDIRNCVYKSGSSISQNCRNNKDELASVTCVELNNAPPEDPIPDLKCTGTTFTATFSKIRDPYLEEKHLSLANQVSCPNLVKRHDTNYVEIEIPFGACGTNVTTNETHIIYSNLIRYDYTTQTGNRVREGNRYIIEVSCEFPRDLTDGLDKEMLPLTQYVTQKAPGQFKINMLFYKNNSFVNPERTYPLQLTLGEWLNVGLYLESIGADLKLIVPNCKATPSNQRNDSVNYPLFENKCANDDTLAFFPLNSTAFGYRYRTFKFVDYDSVILHCDAFVCVLNEESATCDRSCNTSSTVSTTTSSSRRRKREAPNHEYIHVSSPPMFFGRTNSDIQREWDIKTQGASSSIVTVPMTISTVKPSIIRGSTTKSTTNVPATSRSSSPPTTTTTTTKIPTTTTMSTITARKTTTTTTRGKTPTTSTAPKKTPTTTLPRKYTTSHQVIHVTEKSTPIISSNVDNSQSDNEENLANKVEIKTTQKSPVTSSDNMKASKENQEVDMENELFLAGLAGNPFSQSPPMFSFSQTLISLIIMMLFMVLLR